MKKMKHHGFTPMVSLGDPSASCRRRIIFPLAFFIMVSFPFSLFGGKMDKIVAIVNSDIITEEELNLFIKMASSDNEASPLPKDAKELKKEMLERMIEDRLILQKAKRQQLKVDENVIEERIRDIKARAGSELAFETALKTQGFSLNELREKLRNQLMIYTLIQKEIRNRVVISPKEVTDYFEQNQDKFLTPERVVVDSIFVKEKDVLKEVEAQLDKGKDFSELATAYSQKSNLGVVPRGQLKKNLEDFVFALEVGKRSKPFESEDGFYIFLVKEKLPASKQAIDEVKDKITSDLQTAKADKILKDWIEELKDKAYISMREL